MAARTIPQDLPTIEQRDADAALVEQHESKEDFRFSDHERKFCTACDKHAPHYDIDGRSICRWVARHPLNPYVGMPCSILYVTDTRAAVVVRVNAKSVTVQRVATDPESKRTIAERGPWPVVQEDGILTKTVGNPERFAFNGRRFADGSIGLSLGRSVTTIDYSF